MEKAHVVVRMPSDLRDWLKQKLRRIAARSTS